MELTNKQKAVAVLESLQTGEKTPISYINANKYIQHNLAVGDGLEGFGAVVRLFRTKGWFRHLPF